jgi:hypothetical protein
MLLRDRLARLNDGDVGLLKHDRAGGRLAQALLQLCFQALAFFDDRLQAAGNLLIRA